MHITMKHELQHDILISYRHAETMEEARSLKAHLNELQVTSWFDVLNLPQGVTIPEDELKQSLELAVRSSRLLVQFRYDPLVDIANGKTKLLFSWPFFERQFAKEILTVVKLHDDGSGILLSPGGDMHPFYDITHLAYLLALTVGKTDRIDTYWVEHLAAIESHLADRAAKYGVFAWHKLYQKNDWPDIINPDKPEFRRNMLPAAETPEIHPEVVSKHELLMWDGMHCPYCGRSFGILACVIIWLVKNGVICYQCRNRLAYNRKPLDIIVILALLFFMVIGFWRLSLLGFQTIPPVLRAVGTILVSFIIEYCIWGFYLRKWRKLQRCDS